MAARTLTCVGHDKPKIGQVGWGAVLRVRLAAMAELAELRREDHLVILPRPV